MNLPIAPVIAGVLGGAVALAALAVPMPVLEALVMGSGLPAVFAAAEPPLGFTARAVVALGSGGFAALFCWFGLSVLVGARSVTVGQTAAPASDAVATPVIRRADAHPDAPPRPPLLATRDLGAPFRDPPAVEPEPVAAAVPARPIEQPLPTDLDQPLSAFDPEAVPDEPMPAPVAPPPLRRTSRPPVFEETERFEIFELTPSVRAKPSLVVEEVEESAPAPREEAITRPETEATVHALLERLERGVVRKATAATPAPVPMSAPVSMSAPRVERRARPRGIEDTLVTLRNLAQRA
ncbi:hypothetical protein [Sphingomonas psychrotolerans]|uniref:Uncharacterized protein n=1 Tax=Sphingomonas psychrotolerans TaxID=1327635 RepID=A0A2K8MK93_9SPHN|nr:hypothetical protein [Sphingomonas psychrotolerans]ATY32169.1 hypothetical protein CVN68_09420 [Sphingomonas psychrotolerans]